MGLFAAGQVASLPFPFSSLTRDKTRPVLLLASAGREDWIVCQITSNPYADSDAIKLSRHAFAQGSLPHTSYIRPSKLFTAIELLIAVILGSLSPAFLTNVQEAVIQIIRRKATASP